MMYLFIYVGQRQTHVVSRRYSTDDKMQHFEPTVDTDKDITSVFSPRSSSSRSLYDWAGRRVLASGRSRIGVIGCARDARPLGHSLVMVDVR